MGSKSCLEVCSNPLVHDRRLGAGARSRCRSFRQSERCRTHRRLTFEPLEDRRVLATFLVTDLGDSPVTGPDSAPGTLRQVIYDAKFISAGDDLIQFDPGLSGDVNLLVADDMTVGLSSLVITSPITIQGNANGITIRRDAAAQEMRLFLVMADADLTFDSVMLAGGLARGDNGGTGQNGDSSFGGAVYNQGTLQIVASTFYGNAAIGGNAGQGGRGCGSGRRPCTTTAARFRFAL